MAEKVRALYETTSPGEQAACHVVPSQVRTGVATDADARGLVLGFGVRHGTSVFQPVFESVARPGAHLAYQGPDPANDTGSGKNSTSGRPF